MEFWSWGFIADRDTTLNLRYQRMEVYGVNVFSVQGGSATYQIYVRPMSLTRTAQWMTDRSKLAHFAPEADKLKAEVTIDGEPVKVLQTTRARVRYSRADARRLFAHRGYAYEKGVKTLPCVPHCA